MAVASVCGLAVGALTLAMVSMAFASVFAVIRMLIGRGNGFMLLFSIIFGTIFYGLAYFFDWIDRATPASEHPNFFAISGMCVLVGGFVYLFQVIASLWKQAMRRDD